MAREEKSYKTIFTSFIHLLPWQNDRWKQSIKKKDEWVLILIIKRKRIRVRLKTQKWEKVE